MSTPVAPNHQHKIPAVWQNLRRFIFAKLAYNHTTGKSDKLPCDYYGNVCSAHDPAKHLTPQELFGSPIFTNPLYHVAIVIAEGDGNWCIDLDQCFDQQGKLTPGAAAIVAMFPGAYVETSISGKGLHIFGRGTPPPHRTRAAGLELYSRARFILLAGIDAGGDPGIDFTAQLAAFVDTYALRLTAAELATPAAMVSDLPRPGTTGVFLTDAELIDVMRNSRGSGAAAFGEAVHPRDLWDGNEAEIARVLPQPGRSDGCPFDRTRAEGALLQHLMFYTGGHESRTLRLFEQSALWRPGVHDRQPYKLTRPVARAGSTLQRFYDRPPAALPGLPAPGVALDGWEQARAVAAASWGVPGVGVVPAPPILVFPEAVDAAAAILGPIEPLEWTLDGWIPHKAITLFGGDGGIGKTTLSIQLAIAAAGLRPWLGRIVTPRRVLFVSGEDNIPRLVRTVKYIADRMGHDASNLTLLSLDGFAEPYLVRIERNGTVTSTATLEHIVRIMREKSCDMVIFDPVANLWTGDEVNREHVTTFLSVMRNRIATQLGATIVINAHPSREGIKDGTGFSGSSAWNNSVKARLYLRSDPNDQDQRILELAKANDGRAGQKIIMKWDKPIFVSEGTTVSNSPDNIDTVFMSILEKRFKLGMMVSHKPSPTYAPTVFERDEGSNNIKRRDFEHAMMRLKEAGKIDFITDGPASKQRHYVVPTALPTASN